MQFDLVLAGGEIVAEGRVEVADIGIVEGSIAAIGDLRNAPTKELVDLKGLTVLPGLIDTQVHFREPGMTHKEDIESGTRAAVAGGVTTVLEMPNTIPPTTTATALADKLERSKGRAWCNFGFFVGAALDNLDQLAELEMMPGTPGVKLFMGSSTGTLLVGDDEAVRRVLQNGRKRMPVHSEDSFRLEALKLQIRPETSVFDHPLLRDEECARLCTERLLRLSLATGRPVHVLHLSTLEEIPLISEARKMGIDVTTEVTPQHLWFAAPEAYDQLGTLAQMNPPIRTAEHRDALRQALKDGFFTVFGSDHAPHTLEEKALPYPQSPSGMPGVQTLFSALWTLGQEFELFDIHKFVEMACSRPASLYGIQNKGQIRVGFDADLAVVDLKSKYVFERSMVQSKCGWSPFEGARFVGKNVHTLVGGNFALREGEIFGSPCGSIPIFS